MSRLRDLGRRLRGREAEPAAPVLSVVIPVYNVAKYLAECLDSVLGQTLRELEVIAVDDGSTDESLEILRHYAARDDRVHVLTQPNSGQGLARNLAVEHARGEFLTFCDSDDTIPKRAYAYQVKGLRASGSDFSIGVARRFAHNRVLNTAWDRTVHDTDRIGVGVDEFPLAMRDIIACNRVFRRAFWTERCTPFRGGVAYEDHVPMLSALVRAEQFDVLSRITYNWRVREDNTSTGQQKASIANLRDRISVKEEARAMLAAEASTVAYDAWVGRCLDIDFPPFVKQAVSNTDEYRALLSDTYRTFLGRATDDALDTVSHANKVTGWLVAEGRWPEVAEALEYFRVNGRLPVTRVDGGSVVAVPEAGFDVVEEVPERMWRLAAHETALRAGLRVATWTGDSALEISGYAVVRGLDTSEEPPDCEGWLRDEQSGHDVPVDVVATRDAEVNIWAPHPNTAYDWSAFTATVDTSALTPGTWVLRLRVTTQGITRQGGVHDVVEGSPAYLLQPRVVGGVVVKPARDAEHGVTVVVAAGAESPVSNPPTLPAATDVRAVSDAIEVAVLPHGARGDVLASARLLSDDGTSVPVVATEERNETVVLRFPLDPVPPSGPYHLVFSTDEGDARCLVADELLPRIPWSSVNEQVRIRTRVRRSGDLRLVIGPPLDDTERSRSGRRTLRTAYAEAEAAAAWVVPGSVLFQSQLGTAATEDPLAIDRALAGTRPELVRYWTVSDLSVAVPPGAVPLVMGSRRWLDALRSVTYLVSSDDVDDFFQRRPHQRYLQTFKGRPWKGMGAAHWRHRGFSESRVAKELVRRNESWTTLLAPDEASAELYRTAFSFGGDVITVGLPRTDDLVGGDRESARTDVLGRLGIDPATRVVLFAPTYRESLNSRGDAAALPSDLDLGRLATALGPDHTVLLRAHVLNRADAGAAVRGTAVVDVTGHPHVNDLLHAADAAILDYSSLRFDWALTGRPAVCFVPDLEAYVASRPPLSDYEGTNPGPLATTLDEVVALLSSSGAGLDPWYNQQNDGHAATRVVQAFFTD